MRHAILLGLMFSFCALLAHAQDKPAPPSRVQMQSEDPELLSFDELVTLSSTAKPDGDLAAHLNSILTTPFVNNEASAAGIEPHRPAVINLGPVLRVGLWNIERGLNLELIRSALTDTSEFERLAGQTCR